MAVGTYTCFGVDVNLGPGSQDGTVDSTGDAGYSITKVSDGAGSNTDPNTLDIGDIFSVSGFTQQFVYGGTDGAGGIVAIVPVTDDDPGAYYSSDTLYPVGTQFPTLVPGNTVICFTKGTLIATASGERAVETLSIGDPVLTAGGRTVPVKWLGRQTVHRLFTPEERFRPVRIAAGALGEKLPHADLVVTADHGMLLDGVIAHAGALVNGTTISRVPMAELGEREAYYHIETEAHDIILANGAPAETFIDNVSRRAFDNYEEYVSLYGEEADAIVEQPLPRVMSARQLPLRIRQRLEERAFALLGAKALVA